MKKAKEKKKKNGGYAMNEKQKDDFRDDDDDGNKREFWFKICKQAFDNRLEKKGVVEDFPSFVYRRL